MCDPVTLAIGTAVIGGITSGAGFIGQGQQADAQRAFNRQAKTAAVDAAGNAQADINARIVQEEQAATEERIAQGSAYRKAAATTALGAMEAGLSGTGVATLLGDIEATWGRNLATIDRQTDNTVDQLVRQKAGANAQAANRVNSLQPPAAPNLLDLGLGITKAGLQGYDTYNRYKVP